MTILYLILMGPKQDQWTWRATDDHGHETARARQCFNCYLDVLEDARKSGFSEQPEFQSTPKNFEST